jgi:hypothetical protein
MFLIDLNFKNSNIRIFCKLSNQEINVLVIFDCTLNYSKLSYTQANYIVWYRQLIWTIYKIKCSKNIQELKTQANFRVWEIWKSLFCHAVAIKKELWL